MIAAGERHRYVLDMTAGHAARLAVTQTTLDVVVRLGAPNGETLLEIDRPPGTIAPEQVCWISPRGGRYTIEIRPFDAAGTYTVALQATRLATAADRGCAAATAAYDHAGSALAAEDLATRIDHLTRAAELWQAAADPQLAAIAWREAGTVHQKQGQLDQAMVCFERALPLSHAAANTSLEISISNRMGKISLAADDLDAAAAGFARALALARKTSNRRGEATTLTNYGLVDDQRGDPFRAVDRYRDAVALWRQLDEPIEWAQALANLGEALGKLDHHDEALDALNEALALARQTGERAREASFLTLIGWVYRLAGRPENALEPLREALTIRRDLGDTLSEVGVLDRLGTVLRLSGDTSAAEAHYRQALEQSQAPAPRNLGKATQVNLGCLLAETDRHDEAAVLLATGTEYFEQVTDPPSRSHTAYCQARLARYRGDHDEAAVYIRDAMTIVEGLRERARARGHRFPPVGLWQDYADFEVELLIERFRRTNDASDLEQAFTAADRTRARRLYELTAFTRGGAENAAAQVDRQREQDLQTRLAELAARRTALAPTSEPAMTANAEAVEAEIRRHQRELESIRANQRASERAHGLRRSPRAVDIPEVQALLTPNSVFLTYVLGAAGSHLLAMTRETLDVFALPPRAILEAQAEGLHAALADSHRDHSGHGQWSHVAARLGPMLLPVAAIPPGTKRLLISAQGALHYVPFMVLPSPRPSTRPEAGDIRRVVDDFETVSVPSASVWAALRRRHVANGTPAHRTPSRHAPSSQADNLLRVAVFADPVFAADDPRFGHPIVAGPSANTVDRGIMLDRLPAGPLPRLPATADEAAAIGTHLEADQLRLFIGWEATKRTVLDTDLRPYRVLHFATHAWVDERFPELSGLVLTKIGQDGVPRDGALYLHEVDSLALRADLTILSGCQTALGRHIRGDGLMSLTQGFLNAGSRQVLVSLWSVDDVATSRLMAVFYDRFLHHGERPATALRHAQQWLRAQPGYAAPRYWATFVLQGDG